MKKNHVIALTEPNGYSEEAKRILGEVGEVQAFSELKKQRREKAITALVVKLGVAISKPLLTSLPRLQWIATSTTGLNHIDLEEALRRKIEIISLRGEAKFLSSITPTAEETIGLIVMLMRNLSNGFDSIRKGKWEKERWYGRELQGKTLGVIGFGRLGTLVAKYARVMGMQVLATDPHVGEEVMKKAGVKKVSIEEVCKGSDVVSVHVLLTKETEGLITKKYFEMMKPTTYFVNTARGELVDEKSLLKALTEKKIAGAALDVLAGEDPKGSHVKKHPLVEYAKKHTNCIIVPHLGGATFESMEKTENFIAEKLVRAVKNQKKS